MVLLLAVVGVWTNVAGNRAGMTVIGLATTNSEEQIRDKANAVIQDFNGFSFEKMKNMMR